MRALLVLMFAVLLAGCSSTPEPQADSFESSYRLGDEDRDGVLNQVDECPGTPRTTTVDMRGCREDISLDASRSEFLVRFETHSAELPEREQRRLRYVKSAFTNDTVTLIEIEAFTISHEFDELAGDREQVVANYLISLGVDEAKLTIVAPETLSDQHHATSAEEEMINSRVYIRVTHESP